MPERTGVSLPLFEIGLDVVVGLRQWVTHPAVQVDVMCAPSGELVERLKAGDLDLTLASDGHQPRQWPTIPLWRGPLVWVTSTRHAPHRLDPLPLALADRKPFLARGQDCEWAGAAVRAAVRPPG